MRIGMSLGMRMPQGQTIIQRAINTLRKYGTAAHYWDFGISQEKLAYGATHTAAEFLARYPLHHLFQDSAGTLPLYAIGQPCGLVLDQGSGSVVLGAELVTNGGFDSGISGWTAQFSSTQSWQAGILRSVSSGSNAGETSCPIATSPGKVYLVTGSINIGTSNARLAASVLPYVATALGTTGYASTSGSYRFVFTASGSTTYIVAGLSNGASGLFSDFDNISVREVIGSHAAQSTTTKRPIMSARVNLLTATEDFSNAAWAKSQCTVATSSASPPFGSGGVFRFTPSVASATYKSIQQTYLGGPSTGGIVVSFYAKADGYSFATIVLTGSVGRGVFNLATGACINYSGTGVMGCTDVGGGWFRCSFSVTLTGVAPQIWIGGKATSVDSAVATVEDGVSGILLWHPDLRPANSPQNIPAYQRVDSATSYDTVGFPARLVWDGVDDCLVVPTLDLSGADKVTVIAGVGKLSDAAIGVVCEHTTTAGNNGSFTLYAPANAGLARYGFGTRGTAPGFVAVSPYAAPRNDVISVTADNAAGASLSAIKIRANGAAGLSATNDGFTAVGPGNYASAAFHIGQRAASAYPFSGPMQSIAVIGNILPDGEVKLLEDLTNKAMGKVY